MTVIARRVISSRWMFAPELNLAKSFIRIGNKFYYPNRSSQKGILAAMVVVWFNRSSTK